MIAHSCGIGGCLRRSTAGRLVYVFTDSMKPVTEDVIRRALLPLCDHHDVMLGEDHPHLTVALPWAAEGEHMPWREGRTP